MYCPFSRHTFFHLVKLKNTLNRPNRCHCGVIQHTFRVKMISDWFKLFPITIVLGIWPWSLNKERYTSSWLKSFWPESFTYSYTMYTVPCCAFEFCWSPISCPPCCSKSLEFVLATILFPTRSSLRSQSTFPSPVKVSHQKSNFTSLA